MKPQRQFGVEETTNENRAYTGSYFSEVREALFANPYQRVWGSAGEPPLPVYDVTLGGVLRGILPLGTSYLFPKASERTVDSHADLRWGIDGKGFRRILHPNGVCLIGEWRITEQTNYSGYFSKDSAALVVARYSTCCGETRRGNSRSLALIGKLFPTTDPAHPTPLPTANFITQEDIGSADSAFINDAEVCNAPGTTVSRRGAGVPILLGYRHHLQASRSSTRQPSALSNCRTGQAEYATHPRTRIYAARARQRRTFQSTLI